MMQTQSLSQVCHYSKLDNGIYQITMTESSRQAVDGWIAALDVIYAEMSPDELLRTLVDVRTGTLPLGYTMRQMRDFIKRHPQRPRTRTVFYHERGFLIGVVTSLVNALAKRGRDTVKFFPSEQYDEAIQWLLAGV